MTGAAAEVRTIAIIDDDESIRVATSSFVRSLGFDATAFSSAEEYLRSTQRYRASCLISDVQMPGMSGLDLQSHLATQGHRVPIIFITAFPDDSVRSRALAQGAVCFLEKPFDSQALSRCIDMALRDDTGENG